MTLTETRVSNEPVRGWEAFAASPPDLPDQLVTKRELWFDGKIVNNAQAVERSAAKVPILVARFTTAEIGHGDPVGVWTRYEGRLSRVRLVPGAPKTPVEPLSAEERNLDLAATASVDYRSDAVQAFIRRAGLRLKRGEGVVDFGRRVYEYIRKTMKYKADAPFDYVPCSADVGTMVGHCGNYSRLAVAVFRANGIPARVEFGHWVNKSGTFDGGQPHVRAHFYADGVGWVLCDTSIGIPPGGWKPEKNLDIGFGNWRADFLVLHEHGWLELPTKHWGPQPQTHLQGIYLPTVGGTWEGANYKTVLKVELTPAQ